MNVFVFRGPNFSEHEDCFAGWMMRSKPKSNEIFDPKTVEQKIDIRSASKNVMPVVFDLVERKAIWADLSAARGSFGSSYGHFGRRDYGNSVESNKASIEQTMSAIIEAKSKLSLFELFHLHAEARGQLVDNRAEAETVFSLREGITPFNINEIASDFLA